jgi:hypothetical protein
MNFTVSCPGFMYQALVLLLLLLLSVKPSSCVTATLLCVVSRSINATCRLPMGVGRLAELAKQVLDAYGSQRSSS